MHSNVAIRPECPADVAGIFALHAACFPTKAEATLVDALREAGDLSVSLVAEVEGVLVGHVAFSPVRVADASKKASSPGAGLAPVSVAATHRRQGIAELLIREGLEACRHKTFGWAVVLGEPAYYGRFGFQAASDSGLSDEYGGGPAFQCMALTPGALPTGAGLLKYAPAFASLG